MQLQLYMASVMKPYILEQHDFYVAQTNKRVLAQFRDLDGEAYRYAADEYRRLLARPSDEDTDIASLAELFQRSSAK